MRNYFMKGSHILVDGRILYQLQVIKKPSIMFPDFGHPHKFCYTTKAFCNTGWPDVFCLLYLAKNRVLHPISAIIPAVRQTFYLHS